MEMEGTSAAAALGEPASRLQDVSSKTASRETMENKEGIRRNPVELLFKGPPPCPESFPIGGIPCVP